MPTEIRYVPGLKWRQGEYQALWRLGDSAKDQLKPLITIPPIEFDFEERKDKKTPQDHLVTFPKRYLDKWKGRDSFIDFHESLHDAFMDDGVSIMRDLYDKTRLNGSLATAVTGLNRSQNYQTVIRSIHAESTEGLAFRVTLTDLMRSDFDYEINKLIEFHRTQLDRVDLILDLGLPDSFVPYKVMASALVGRLTSILRLNELRSLIIVGSSIQIQGVKPPGATLIRHEWKLFNEFLSLISDIKVPIFGDYCTESPVFPNPPMDMRFVKAPGKIIYTRSDEWDFVKGTALRGNKVQMIDLCKRVANSSGFSGGNFSWGDKMISDTASGVEEPSGSPTIWKQVGFNHHMTFVIEQLQ